MSKDNSLKTRKKTTREVNYSLIPPFPKEILIDISSLCNHSCNFCSNVKMRNKLHASDDMVYKALDEAKNEGSEAVGLYATGEPFLNKNLEVFIKHAKNWIQIRFCNNKRCGSYTKKNCTSY